MTVHASHVRSARSYLRKHLKARAGDVPPRKFAAASQETGIGFRELLGVIARMYEGGQGEASQRREDIRSIAQAGT
jgi:hypothetical protein